MSSLSHSRWFTTSNGGDKQIADANKYGMFAAARQNVPKSQEIQDTGIELTQMAPDVAAKFKNSLRSKRWNKIDLGGTANYTNENMVNRWNVEKNKWLEVSVPIY